MISIFTENAGIFGPLSQVVKRDPDWPKHGQGVAPCCATGCVGRNPACHTAQQQQLYEL